MIRRRSDATLNPGGVRIGTAEIDAEVEKSAQVRELVVIGQNTGDDVRVVLFVEMAEGHTLDEALVAEIRTAIRRVAARRHVPALVLAVADIPRTKSGKISELAVRDTVEGHAIRNAGAFANPEALALFEGVAALRIG